MLYALLALVSAVIAAGSFYFFQSNKDPNNSGTLYLVVGAVFVLLTVVFGVIFMSGRVNKTEDIHITE